MKKGFSILEIMLVIAIIAILLAIVLPSLTKSRNTQALSASTEAVISVLNQARSKTLSSEKDTAYGVKIDSASVTLFVGTTYNAGTQTNIVTNLQNNITIPSGNVSLAGGGSEVVFNRLTGATDDFGTVIVQVSNDSNSKKTITIEKTGNVKTN
jgi:prepilin-type N-terminal cleavage/methylation domain-containing protein